MLDGPLVFVDIDTQRDFLEPDGALFVPGSAAILENLARLTNFARSRGIPVSRPPARILSTTLRKSRGANRSVGVTMSVLPQRMNCLPTSNVSGPCDSVALALLIDNAGRSRPRSRKSGRHESDT